MFRQPGTLAKRPSQLLKACWLSAVLRPAQAAASHRNCNPEWHVVQPLRPPKWRWLRASLFHRRTPATRAAGASGRAHTNPSPAVLAAKVALAAMRQSITWTSFRARRCCGKLLKPRECRKA